MNMSEKESTSQMSGTGLLGSIPTPLLHEVTALLEKERILSELRVLEQEAQATKWKEKYADLKEKIIEAKAVEPEDAAKLEKLGEVEDEEDEDPMDIPKRGGNNLAGLLLQNVHGTLGNFSHIPLTKQIFSGIVKSLFGSHSQYPEMAVLWVKDCGLDHASIDAIEYLLRTARLQGLDISGNNLDDDVLFSFVEVLNTKKKTPQYLLLHGIPSWARSDRAYLELLQTLSKETWGISISLLDMISNPKEVLQKSIQVGKKKGEKEDELMFKDFKQPYRIARFLQALRLKLEESVMSEVELELANLAKKNSAIPQRAGKKKNQSHVETIGRFGKQMPRLADNIKDLYVLGLTEHPLSSHALREFELLLHRVSSTLTDLDLSFSYIGVHGAAILEKFLLDPQSQLVALRLKGNCLGDPGFERIGQTLKKNNSLTYLDVSNNCISWTGLSAIRPLLISSRTLMHLDLTNNEIIASDAAELDNELRDVSSSLFVKWFEYSKPEILWRIPKKSAIVYDNPRASSKLCGLGRRVLLARVNLTDVYFHHPHDEHKPLVLRWNMRPAPQRTHEDVQSDIVLRNKPLDPQNIDEEPYALLNVFTCFGWEVTITHNRHEYFHTSDDISGEFNTRDLFCEGQQWVANSIVLKDPPSKGTVSIYGYLRLKQERDIRGRPVRFIPSRQFMRVEWKDLIMYPLHTTSSTGGWFHVGGDPAERSPFEFQDINANEFWHYQNFPLLKEHHLLRGLTWQFPKNVVKIVFEAKLCLLRQTEEEKTSIQVDESAIHGGIYDDDDEGGLNFDDQDMYDSEEEEALQAKLAAVQKNGERIQLDRQGRPRHLAHTTFDFDCFLTIHRRLQKPTQLQRFRCSKEVKRLCMEERRRRRLLRKKTRPKRNTVAAHSVGTASAAAVLNEDDEDQKAAVWPEVPTIEQLITGVGDDGNDVEWYNVQYHQSDLGTSRKERVSDALEGEFDLNDDMFVENSDSEIENQDEVDAKEDPHPLLAWRWQKFVLYATDVNCTDTLFLTGLPCIHNPGAGIESRESGSAQANLTPRQKKLLAQIGVVARNVQIYSYIGDAQRYDRQAFAEITPTLLCPEDVFSPFYLYDTVDRDAEEKKRVDGWKHMFEAYGLDTDKLHHTEMADALNYPDVSIDEASMKSFKEYAMAEGAKCVAATKQYFENTNGI